jgi:hypothetical protein
VFCAGDADLDGDMAVRAVQERLRGLKAAMDASARIGWDQMVMRVDRWSRAQGEPKRRRTCHVRRGTADVVIPACAPCYGF